MKALWETHSPFEAALKPLYVVKIEKLGDLLLQIGRRLATSQPATKAKTFAEEEKRTAASQPQTNMQGKARTRQTAKGRGEDPGFASLNDQVLPVAFREDDGWVRMSLTSFYLPPYCCICTVPTRNTFLFNIPNQGESGHYPLHLFTCDQCCHRLKRRKRIIGLFGFGVPFAFILTMIVSFDRNRAWLAGLLIALTIASFFATCIAVEKLLKRPAKVRYSSKKGIFRIRFRNQNYEDMVLALRVPKQ